MPDEIVVRVPRRRAQYHHLVIERMAREQGTTPVELMKEALQSSYSQGEAAAKLGVSRQTLNKWRHRYGIKLVAEEYELCPICKEAYVDPAEAVMCERSHRRKRDKGDGNE